MYLPKLIKFKTNLTIFIIFALINIFINRELVRELFTTDYYRTFGSDTIVVQNLSEFYYQNLLKFQNPFKFHNGLFYPLGTQTALQDQGFIHSLYFLIFRHFFSIHKSLIISILISIFLAQVFMFLLLKQLKVSRGISFIFSLAFAFMPFMNTRIQVHLAYMHYFLLPLTAWSSLLLIKEKKVMKNIFLATLVGLSLALLTYTTFYVFATFILVLTIFPFIYFLINWKDKSKIILNFLPKIKYLFFSFFVFILFIYPFIIEQWESIKFEGFFTQAKLQGGDALYAASPVSIFIPSPQNYFYGKYSDELFRVFSNWDGISYLGILCLLGVVVYIRDKNKLKNLPIALTSMVLYILSFGPLIKISNPLTSKVLASFPLPYMLFINIPLLSLFRAPIRFALPLSFCVAILAARAINGRLAKITQKKIYILFLFLIFFFDQSYFLTHKPYTPKLPLQSYERIKKDNDPVAVLEIPFTTQDGLFLHGGNCDFLNFEIGQIIHQKPVVGGYVARVHSYKFNYYDSNPAIKYFSRFCRFSTQNVAKRDIQYFVNNQRPPTDVIRKNLDFLNIKYILVSKKPEYNQIQQDLQEINYSPVIEEDNGFVLYQKDISNESLNTFNLGQKSDIAYLFGNWSEPVDGGRWIKGLRAGLLFKPAQGGKSNIQIRVHTKDKNRLLKFFINGEFVKKMEIGSSENKIMIDSVNVSAGINRIDFILDTDNILDLFRKETKEGSIFVSGVEVGGGKINEERI